MRCLTQSLIQWWLFRSSFACIDQHPGTRSYVPAQCLGVWVSLSHSQCSIWMLSYVKAAVCCKCTYPLPSCTGRLQFRVLKIMWKMRFISFRQLIKVNLILIFLAPREKIFQGSQNMWVLQMTAIKCGICFPAIMHLVWEGQRTLLRSQRPQKAIPGSSSKNSETSRKKETELKQITEIHRLWDHYWMSLVFKNLCALKHTYDVPTQWVWCPTGSGALVMVWFIWIRLS